MFRFKKKLPDEESARIAEENDQYKRGYSDGYDQAFNTSYDHARDLILFQDSLINGLYRRIDALKNASCSNADENSNDCSCKCYDRDS